MNRRFIAFLAAAFPALALAVPPDSCELLTPEEINKVAERVVTHALPVKTGNPSHCNFVDSKKTAVVIVTVREVQYAVQQEMQSERDNMEKIYRSSSKSIESVGDAAFWMPVSKQLWFRKGKLIVSVAFGTPKNQNELDTGILARVVESRIKK